MDLFWWLVLWPILLVFAVVWVASMILLWMLEAAHWVVDLLWGALSGRLRR